MTEISGGASRWRTARPWLAALIVPVAIMAALVAIQATAGAAPGPVDLGTASNFGVLAGTTVTNTGFSVITDGDLGVSPGSAVTGFPPGSLVDGSMEVANPQAAIAQSDLTTAYNEAAGQTPTAPSVTFIGAGQTLTAGVYNATSSLEVGGTLTLDGQGDPNAVFIFQAASTLTTDVGTNIVLTNGANACNVYWQVGSSATLFTSTTFEGSIMALTSISVQHRGVIVGRMLARNGAVTLDDDTILVPPSCGPLSSPSPSTSTSTSPSPSPSPTTTSPSPSPSPTTTSPSPSPSPTTTSPSPSPSPTTTSPSPSPSPTTTSPSPSPSPTTTSPSPRPSRNSHCKMSASPISFVEQGLGAHTSSVAFVFNVECQPVYGESIVELHTPQLNNACHDTLKWYSATGSGPDGVDPSHGTGESFDVMLDDDGNAEAVVWGGPSCGATSALVEASPGTSAVTIVDIKPPTDTPPGLTIWPSKQIEDSTTSSVATIFYAEYSSRFAESRVEFSDAQLYDRCAGGITWIGSDDVTLATHTKSVVTTLDDNGNAFVVALAGPSCASGATLGTADLVGPPYTTYASRFWVLSPRVSADTARAIS